MATRATLTVFDSQERYDIYRHYDGYPESEHGVLQAIVDAQRLALPLPSFQAGEFAAALIATLKTQPGGVLLTSDARQHGDVAFRYVITERRGALFVAVQQIDWQETDNGPQKDLREVFRGTLSEALTRFTV